MSETDLRRHQHVLAVALEILAREGLDVSGLVANERVQQSSENGQGIENNSEKSLNFLGFAQGGDENPLRVHDDIVDAFIKHIEEIESRNKVSYYQSDKISEESIDNSPQSVVSKRLEQIDEYVLSNPGRPVSELVRSLFPGLEHALEDASVTLNEPVNLPNDAPEHWRNRSDPNENPPDFVKRVYSQWLGRGFTKADLRRLDQPLMQALNYFERKHGLPDDLDLPTKAEQNTRWIEKIGQGQAVGSPDGQIDMDTIRAARRLDAVARRRRSGSPEK